MTALPVHAGDACDRVTVLDEALRTVSQDGRVIDQRVVGRLDHLPDPWRTERTRVHYRIALSACPGSDDRGLWIYRIGAPYRAWLDGRALMAIDPAAHLDRQQAHVYNGRVPALFRLPAGARVLDIELVTVPYVRSGFVRVVTGPQESLLDMRVIDRGALTSVNDTASAIVGAMGLLVLLVWRMRRRDPMVFWFGVACVAWALRGGVYQTFVYPLSALAMEQFNPWMVLTTVVCLSLSTLHGMGQARPRMVRSMAAAYLAITLAMGGALWLEQGSGAMRSVALAFAFALICHTQIQLVRHWRRQPSTAHGLLAVGLFVLIAGSFHDLGMVMGWIQPDHWSFITPAFTVLLLAQTVAVSSYLGQSLHRAELANEVLERSIAAKSRELEQSYALLRESERASARAQERARFNREIHDGLGAQLITALRGVERGALDKAQLAQTLQEGLDELRLLMDSSDLGQSLHDALASWRNRWDPRLQALGMSLHWGVDPALEVLGLGGDATLQVMRVLQEAVTNAVKHAQARSVTVHARFISGDRPALVLEVGDDGVGLRHGAGSHSGRGLGNMRQRAGRLGADLTVEDVPPPGTGVIVRLRLPLRDDDFAGVRPQPLPDAA